MHAKYKEILEWVRDEVPELLGLDEVEEDTDPDSNLGRACAMFGKASLLLDPQPPQCEEALLPVLVELNRIAPEQNWIPEWNDGKQYLAASSGATEVHVEVGDCSLSKRIRHTWTVVTIGPCDYAHDSPPPSVDEVFTSGNPLAIARRAASEDYSTTIHYA